MFFLMWKFILLLTILLPVVSPYPEDGDEATEYEKDFDGFDQDADGSRTRYPPVKLTLWLGVIDAQEIRSVYNGDLQPQELDAFVSCCDIRCTSVWSQVREVDTNQDGLSERSYDLMHIDSSFQSTTQSTSTMPWSATDHVYHGFMILCTYYSNIFSRCCVHYSGWETDDRNVFKLDKRFST